MSKRKRYFFEDKKMEREMERDEERDPNLYSYYSFTDQKCTVTIETISPDQGDIMQDTSQF